MEQYRYTLQVRYILTKLFLFYINKSTIILINIAATISNDIVLNITVNSMTGSLILFNIFNLILLS